MNRITPAFSSLPHALYRAEQVRELDRVAIEEYGIRGAVLMERAGAAAFRLLRELWPDADDLTVVCGAGNNGGDGYVVARLAKTEGLAVRVLELADPEKLRGDARTMAGAYLEAGGLAEPFDHLPSRTSLIVDAVLGTGLEREVTGRWADALRSMSRHQAPVLAIDIPSGLHADSGRVLGEAVRAAATISFIGLKQGLFTGDGPERAGSVYFDALEVPAAIYARQILSARRLDWRKQSRLLAPRDRGAHKGHFGHVLVVGGAPGYSGAARMAGEAAARCGAGLVSLATSPEHASVVGTTRPELMCHGVSTPEDLEPLLQRATVVAVGPGLGRSSWGQTLMRRVLDCSQPLVVDADGLNLLAATAQRRESWVLTPHPGEAARLLGIQVKDVQADRFHAAARMQAQYGGVCVLKGAGTLVHGGEARPPAVCGAGNPGMASGGMGDVLTGVVAALVAQGLSLGDAAETGVCVHAAAADIAASQGERGLLASDLLVPLRRLLNPAEDAC